MTAKGPVGAFLLAVAFAGSCVANAQQSASYSATEFVLNAGGHPAEGATLSSASYRVSLDALGEGLIATSLSSGSYQMGVGFVTAYPPPREVNNLRFASHTGFNWLPDSAVGTYTVYRELIATLPGNFGVCFPPALTSTAANDISDPPVGAGWFYLVTARNRLGEEGTKGFRSSGAQRPNPSPCP